MKGKVCLITGANRGIGFETARAVAQKGATVVMLCRSKGKGEQARRAIIDATGNSNVELIVCDLSLQEDVRRAAAELKSRHDKLHVLVNNAGIFLQKREVTKEGIERVLATNYLSHFLLTHLLLDTMKASVPARIVNVATKTMGLKIDLDDLMLEKSYSFMSSMGRTKLGLILFTMELSKRLEGTGVTVNAMHPGVVQTELLNDVPKFFTFVFKLMARSLEKGASTAVYLATSPAVEGVSGKLYADCKPVTIGGQAKQPGLAERLWKMSSDLTKAAA
ncbi:MAG: SDR family oxidoreductase [Deltaproteobacteria bacterium]|nr:SDR family oxidoreductase [Deltaproteobacteria bacterium]